MGRLRQMGTAGPVRDQQHSKTVTSVTANSARGHFKNVVLQCASMTEFLDD